mgnify:FL=1
MKRPVLETRLGLNKVTPGQNEFGRLLFRLRPTPFDSYLLELPQQLSLMAALLENGDSFYGSLVAVRASGQFAQSMETLLLRLQYGEHLERALEMMRLETKSAAVGEFCSKLLLALQRGTPVAEQLRSQAATARSQLRNQLLRKAGGNEVKMLVPLVFVILPVTIAFALYPSLQLLQLGI